MLHWRWMLESDGVAVHESFKSEVIDSTFSTVTGAGYSVLEAECRMLAAYHEMNREGFSVE